MKMKKYYLFILLFCIGLLISAIEPKDYFTWILEVFPSIIGCCILIFTFSRFTFSDFAYIFILLHCYILFIGGHYTYAEVPLFDWIKEVLHQSRNNFDKVGHFAQGFVPAIICREIFIRNKIIPSKKWIAVLTVAVCMSISACYEFLEWFVAIVSGQSAESFLGTQGYVWDTQSDMLYATIGASSMVLFFAKWHNKQMDKLK